jgi:predicted DNA-binding transcriptional regulator AlpA
MKNMTKPDTNPDRLIRLSEVLEIIPVSASTWWEGVRRGRYPPAIKLGPRLTCWRLRDILELVETGQR